MTRVLLILCLSLLVAGYTSAQEFMIYPSEGQSDEQMEQDKFQCYSWAKQQSGFDPMAPPTATAPPPEKEAKQGGVVPGAVGGAVVGGAIGAIVGDSGKATRRGLAAGAATGGLVGGMRRNEQVQREQQKQQQWEQQQVQQYSQNRNNYNRAYAACLEGRGYTVR